MGKQPSLLTIHEPANVKVSLFLLWSAPATWLLCFSSTRNICLCVLSFFLPIFVITQSWCTCDSSQQPGLGCSPSYRPWFCSSSGGGKHCSLLSCHEIRTQILQIPLWILSHQRGFVIYTSQFLESCIYSEDVSFSADPNLLVPSKGSLHTVRVMHII